MVFYSKIFLTTYGGAYGGAYGGRNRQNESTISESTARRNAGHWVTIEDGQFTFRTPSKSLYIGHQHSLTSRVVSRQGFTTNNQSVGVVNQLNDFSRQVGGRNQLMARRLPDLNGAEASQIKPPGPAQKMINVSRLQQSFLTVRKPNKSASRHLREATNYSCGY